ncbi:hypothetical protein JL722_1719 [Aureococcus anophagefferens]|nr:hypothetical protein JL722_1719 [Aureococcus anophagefferens]
MARPRPRRREAAKRCWVVAHGLANGSRGAYAAAVGCLCYEDARDASKLGNVTTAFRHSTDAKTAFEAAASLGAPATRAFALMMAGKLAWRDAARPFDDRVRRDRACRKDDPYHARAIHYHGRALLLAAKLSSAGEPPSAARDAFVEAAVGDARAALDALCDRKRPQVVALWRVEGVSGCQAGLDANHRKYDRSRFKHLALYVAVLADLRDHDRLRGVAGWIASSKERRTSTRATPAPAPPPPRRRAAAPPAPPPAADAAMADAPPPAADAAMADAPPPDAADAAADAADAVPPPPVAAGPPPALEAALGLFVDSAAQVYKDCGPDADAPRRHGGRAVRGGRAARRVARRPPVRPPRARSSPRAGTRSEDPQKAQV